MKKIKQDLLNGWKIKTGIENLKILSNKNIFAIIDMSSEGICIIIEFTSSNSFRVSSMSWACNIEVDYKNKIIYLIESPDKINEN